MGLLSLIFFKSGGLNCGGHYSWKPAIIALFKERDSNRLLVIGSVHHSGGKKSEIPMLLEKVSEVSAQDKSIPYLVAGDYNHTASEMKTKDQAYYVAEADDSAPGTMAGPDYGYTNSCIDNAITDDASVKGKRIQLPIAKPLLPDLTLDFVLERVAQKPPGL